MLLQDLKIACLSETERGWGWVGGERERARERESLLGTILHVPGVKYRIVCIA
jgi:hypothetical protein